MPINSDMGCELSNIGREDGFQPAKRVHLEHKATLCGGGYTDFNLPRDVQGLESLDVHEFDSKTHLKHWSPRKEPWLIFKSG